MTKPRDEYLEGILHHKTPDRLLRQAGMIDERMKHSPNMVMITVEVAPVHCPCGITFTPNRAASMFICQCGRKYYCVIRKIHTFKEDTGK